MCALEFVSLSCSILCSRRHLYWRHLYWHHWSLDEWGRYLSVWLLPRWLEGDKAPSSNVGLKTLLFESSNLSGTAGLGWGLSFSQNPSSANLVKIEDSGVRRKFAQVSTGVEIFPELEWVPQPALLPSGLLVLTRPHQIGVRLEITLRCFFGDMG